MSERRLHSIEALEDGRFKVSFDDPVQGIVSFQFERRLQPFDQFTVQGYVEWVGAGIAAPKEVVEAVFAFAQARAVRF